MYHDNRPPGAPPSCPREVLVLEADDFPCDIDEMVREIGDTSSTEDTDPDAQEGARIYWYVNETDPRRVWDCTERALRSQLARWNKKPESFVVPEDRRVRD